MIKSLAILDDSVQIMKIVFSVCNIFLILVTTSRDNSFKLLLKI